MSMRASAARMAAVLIKELIQMRRDRITFAMILVVPLMQLMLFGFAINTDPKHLPTALHLEEETPLVRRILQGMENSQYFAFVKTVDDPRETPELLKEGSVAFVVTVPAGFTRKLIRGEHPSLLIEADASDPAAASNAVAGLPEIVSEALRSELKGQLGYLHDSLPAARVIVHRHYNPEGITQYNIVPGLLGVILTMTMVMITSMAMTREVERGNLENLLAMPLKPHEVMIGKITPYILVGLAQTIVVLTAAHFIFAVPFFGSLTLLLAGVGLFILANLALGFTFSTLAQSQMQAMQLTFFFFLPSILLSGFMFPFRGMPEWAQVIGSGLPLTHFLRIVRGVMLKGSTFGELASEFFAIFLFLFFVGAIAVKRYRRTLD